MPLPRRDSDFPEWLVPARNNIQHELLRIKNLLADSPQSIDAVQRSLDEDQLNLVLGAAYSLRRAVFQAGHQFDQRTVISTAREFVDEVVRNNAAMHNTELKSWSLGYYLRGRFESYVPRRSTISSHSGSRNLRCNYRLVEAGIAGRKNANLLETSLIC